MSDTFSKAKRSEIMSKIRSKNTSPELLVRSIIHRMGYRFCLHRKNLPGNPDIVLPRHKKIIQVFGCLWHGHVDCPRAKEPKSNVLFWREKIKRNKKRDADTLSDLINLGWTVLVVWQCETRSVKKRDILYSKLQKFLQDDQE